MNRKLTLLLTLAFLNAVAFADMKTITEAYEISLSDFRAPGNQNGTVSMRTCSNCAAQILRVNARTQYSVNGQAVSLSDFRQQLKSAANRDNTQVVVAHHLESDTVTAVTLNY